MKVYKKLMNALATVEKIVLVISTLLILVLTVGNVFSRKVIHQLMVLYRRTCCCGISYLITLLGSSTVMCVREDWSA